MKDTAHTAAEPRLAETIQGRLRRARGFMKDSGVDALLVYSGDPHFTGAPPACWQLRQWLSGFTGSAGTLIVTAQRAVLFTDSRYWEQAETELAGTGIEVGRQASAFSAEYLDWLTDELPRGARVAVEGRTMSITNGRAARASFVEAGLALATDLDLHDAIWGSERPAAPSRPIYEHEARWSDVSRAEKLSALRVALQAARATHLLVSSLDDIAWLNNLRGSDLPVSPLFFAFMMIDETHATLFVTEGTLPAALQVKLKADGVEVTPYSAVTASVAGLAPQARVLLDPAATSVVLRDRVPVSVDVIEGVNPIVLAKARKTDGELACFRAAMLQDGAAMCRFYASFERRLAAGERVTEVDVAVGLEAERSAGEHFVGLSFPTTSAFNANGAMMHYKADDRSHAVLEGDGLLLVDSGGQYLGATTDITRMWPIGTPSIEQRRDVTLVLKSVVAMTETRFPRGTLSPMLDSIARRPLWAHGLDFAHATGHGVGFFLNVHEGPQTISRRLPDATMAMQPGMVTSIEPGIYRAGKWGIRIENLAAAVPVETPERGAFGETLEFETLTLCPIDARCLLPELLLPHEIDWLDRYNASVRERLAPLVDGDAREWLDQRTRPLASNPALARA